MSLYARLATWFARRRPSARSSEMPKILVVVEGVYDIVFMRHISEILHAHDPRLPNLATMERRGELLFVPVGGGDLRLWATRFAPLSCSEFHLYDGEGAEERQLRQEVADIVNLRPGCRAMITRKRSMENYVHPAAIFEASGIELTFTDNDPVADLLAAHRYEQQGATTPWDQLESRVRKRRRNRVKKWRHTTAVTRMTPERLAETDPDGEVVGWLQAIARLIAGRR